MDTLVFQDENNKRNSLMIQNDCGLRKDEWIKECEDHERKEIYIDLKFASENTIELSEITLDFDSTEYSTASVVVQKHNLENSHPDSSEIYLKNSDKLGVTIYKQIYENIKNDFELSKKTMQQQHKDNLEHMAKTQLQLELKLTQALEDLKRQTMIAEEWKMNVKGLKNEMDGLKLLIDDQTEKIRSFEKKQKRNIAEKKTIKYDLTKEKKIKEKRDKENCLLEKYIIENSISNSKLEFKAIQKEFDQINCDQKHEVEILIKQKAEFERNLQNQTDQLEKLSEQVRFLEKSKLFLERTLETIRKDAKYKAQKKEEEMEDLRNNFQKKIKAFEQQLEKEHKDRSILLREKLEMEKRLQAAAELERQDRARFQELKRDLKRTKALLRDMQVQLERQKADSSGTATIRQLRNQLEDLECARAIAVKAKHSLETDLSDLHSQVEVIQKEKQDAEENAKAYFREKCTLQSQLEETEDELNDVLKKFENAIQQMSRDQHALQEQVSFISNLEIDRNHLNENVGFFGSVTIMDKYNLLVKRSEMKINELKSKLELEQANRSKLELEISRYKDTSEKIKSELATAIWKQQQEQDQNWKIQMQLKEVKEEMNKNLINVMKKEELEKRYELLEIESTNIKNDLKIALQRVDYLQSALQGDIENSVSKQDNFM